MAQQPDQYARPSSLTNGGSQHNAMLFWLDQMLGSRFTVVLVKIIAVTAKGEIAPVGYVDVQPMINQLDADGNAFAHGTVHELPYFRLQGGANAVVIDPQVGDIGLALVADRDISAVKATKKVSNPGSMRRADMADGLYLGGFLNAVPTQWVQFSEAGIKIHSPVAIVLDAPDIQLNAETITLSATTRTTITTPEFIVNATSQFNGTITASDTITAPDVIGGGKSLKSHVHSGVSRGSGNTDSPA